MVWTQELFHIYVLHFPRLPCGTFFDTHVSSQIVDVITAKKNKLTSHCDPLTRRLWIAKDKANIFSIGKTGIVEQSKTLYLKTDACKRTKKIAEKF